MKYYAGSDIGKIRQENEDYIFASKDSIGLLPNLFIVADGMGGHKAGEYASRFAIAEAVKFIKHSRKPNPVNIMKDAINAANERIYKEGVLDPRLSGMGTTFVMACIIDTKLYVANIGDSRLYLVRNGLKQITKDHSLVEELASKGLIERGSEDYYNQKNVITRALGTESEVYADFFEVDLQKEDFILLCSDGLTNMLSDADIFDTILTANETAAMVSNLIIKSKKKGGNDNISVIVIDPEI